MKPIILPLLALLFAALTAASASAAGPKQFSDERCFDIKQSVLADLPRFCGSVAADHERIDDFGRQIGMLEKNCNQPQLARILRKAVADRANYQDGKGCMAQAERAVLPPKAQAAAEADEL